jgi:hypothetical protein
MDEESRRLLRVLLHRVLHWQESAEATAVIEPPLEFVNHDAVTVSSIGLLRQLFALFVAWEEVVAIK